jgi:pimeloyl-ACP methyl ester carboxylesterase
VSDVVDGVVVADGRKVAYNRYGVGEPERTLLQYGTPGVRRLSPQYLLPAHRAGTELLVIDRPGYGGSDRRPDRRVVDVVGDVAAVLDAVGWLRCAVGRIRRWAACAGCGRAAATSGEPVRKCGGAGPTGRPRTRLVRRHVPGQR